MSVDSASSAAKVLALIPAYNEAQRIAPVVQATMAHLPLLVVDDGSRDDTVKVSEEAGAEVLRQIPNQGKGAALRAGFRAAMDRGFSAVLTLDADGQHDPEEIPKFLEAYAQRQGDLIIGARQFGEMPFIRRMSNTFARWSLSRVVGQHIEDNQSGYRLLSTELMSKLLVSDEQGFEFEVEMIVVCVRDGLKLDWVPIRTIYADEESHIRPWAHTKNYFRVLKKAAGMMKGAGGRS